MQVLCAASLKSKGSINVSRQSSVCLYLFIRSILIGKVIATSIEDKDIRVLQAVSYMMNTLFVIVQRLSKKERIKFPSKTSKEMWLIQIWHIPNLQKRTMP